MAQRVNETPIMKQYRDMKLKHPDAILMFRVGDFYEIFGEDAAIAAEILGITLTRRANGKSPFIYLTGFPYHALDTYLPRLVRAGKRVAICEQIDEPKIKKATPVKNAPKSTPKEDNIGYRCFLGVLSAFTQALSQLYIFEEIRRKTQEILKLTSKLGISPKKAFEECSIVKQPSLFDKQ